MLNDKEITEINGIVENIVYRNSENNYTVLECNSDGELFSAVGVISDISPGEEIRLKGNWTTHATFGRQFKIEAYERFLPDSSAKLYRYLASGTIKGIGPKTALKIIEKFGENSFDILDSQPEKLASINGISLNKAVAICAEFNKQYSMRKIIIELERYGLSPSECTAAFKYFGVGAYQTIQKNPYILCGVLNGFSFDRAEELVAKMELSPQPFDRNGAGIIHIIRHNLGNGHTCIPRAKLYEPALNLLNIDENTADETVDTLIENRRLVSAVLEDEEYVFLPESFSAEYSIAKRMKTILRFPPTPITDVDRDIEANEKRSSLQYAQKQKEAIHIAAEKGLLILTGGPGTGKTTAVKALIDIFESRHVQVLLCAPTGMAAKRLSDVTGREAKTIHRLLEVEWDETDKPVFRKNAEEPLSCGAIVVDEMSMVDIDLFASLLDALPMGSRLILVGDSDQLPSVGPGNVLSDLIRAGVLPVVSLTEIFRQAQKSLIVMNAHRIMNNEPMVLNRTDSDFFFMPRETPIQTASAVAELISRRLPAAYGLSPMNDIQILCPSRKGDCGTVNLNKRLQEVLNPSDKYKKELRTPGGRIFREGDRVMQIKNNYNIPWSKGYEEGEGVFNGDIGLITRINYASGIMNIQFDERNAEYPCDNLSELELAYAVTVHKSQGNEYPVVILPVSDCPPLLMYRNLLYTAVTRAKKILILVGSESKILDMVRNVRHNRRYSALKFFVLN